ncbi:DUF4406 domain-containing protein [Alicyclobacillus contaminans]|uniref:DUF4406 domain-containing protein n=1 Tax=Alicyclobacillus contaminans TaxID=392016 RepID=UPI00041BB2A6|nr:DUF4406 domain-containing protein [Alicyclobacillus contaminans]
MKVYISGPMSGIKDWNYPMFFATAELLRRLGFDVINPAEGVSEFDKPWNWYMRRALRLMMDADTILMLPGWSRSRGARLERMVAKKLGMRVVERLEDLD